MNELWELPTRDPINVILRSYPLWWRSSETLVTIANPTSVQSGHTIFFNLDAIVWSSRGLLQINNAHDWVWFSDFTPQTMDDLHDEEWDIVWLKSVHPNDLETTLRYVERMIHDLNFVPKVYIGLNEDLASIEGEYMLNRPPLHPTSFSVGYDSDSLPNYNPEDILPRIGDIPFPDEGPALVLLLGQVSSAISDADEYLFQQHWITGDNEDPDAVRELLESGEMVVLHNAALISEERSFWSELAQEFGITPMVIWATKTTPWSPLLNATAARYSRDFQDPRDDPNLVVYRWD